MNTRTKSALDRMATQRPSPEELVGDRRSNGMPPLLLDELNRTPAPSAARSTVRGPARRRLLVAAGIAAVAVAGSVVAVPRLTGSTAYATTPPMLHYTSVGTTETAASILTRLATRARSQPQPPGSGPYHYVKTHGWYLQTKMTTDMEVFSSGIEPSDREQWTASDGSGRLNVTRDGKPTSISGGFEPGGLTAGFITEDAAGDLRAVLAERNGASTAAGWFTTMRELWIGQVVPPELQGAVLSILATQPDVTVRGTTTDRAGRQGIAFSAVDRSHHPDMRYVLVLDPQTGMVLDYEEVALEAGDLPIQAPATIGYTEFIASGYTTNTTTRP